ncbi:hypothetical protein R1sor_006377 [Riccia sorocarpa]|uniref:ATP-grasp domain-containing protein n=1 Tax=Riccia sorocarpa TaxID=122646 RepID=A0ABD3HRH8_9MARC
MKSRLPTSGLRICVLQSSYAGANHVVEGVDQDYCDPSKFTDEHVFEHRWLHKATAVEQIDSILEEGFDLYLNILWGQHEDGVAGIDAVKYLETKNIPIIGLPSRILERTKLDFYRDAEQAKVNVPSTGIGRCQFPVIVKPAKCCSSMYVDETSVCSTEAELNQQLATLNSKLEVGRKIAREAGQPVPQKNDDIVIQEYIAGQDFSCVVVEIMDVPVALTPTIYRYPPCVENSTYRFLTFEAKFHPELKEELVRRSANPKLFDELQWLAVESWKANKMTGASWGNVDMRQRSTDGKLFAIEVNPMPAVFIPNGHFEDDVIRAFPGGHPGFMNVIIETALQRYHGKSLVPTKIAAVYDKFAPTYEAAAEAGYRATGGKSRMLGIDVSKGMVKLAQEDPEGPLYDDIHIGPMQDVLSHLTGPYDHIVSLSTLHFIPPLQLSVVLARFFQLARKSVTFTVDTLTESYNKHLEERGVPEMCGWDHTAKVEKFVKHLPPGWKIVEGHGLGLKWKSHHTEDVIQMLVYRFEKVDGEEAVF